MIPIIIEITLDWEQKPKQGNVIFGEKETIYSDFAGR